MALELNGVSYTYAAGSSYSVSALASVDLVVPRGGLVLVLGRTGSGKSTLLRIAAGLTDPTSGTVTADGSRAKGRVGLVFQDPESQLFADTVLGDVAFGPRNDGLSHAEARRRAREALAMTGLDPDAFGERSPFGLSGGEARRVAVAGVLVMRRPYLLLDEPTAGLDSHGRSAVMQAILSAREHAGVAVVTHDAEEFLPYADRVVLLVDGGVAADLSVAELLADPAGAEASGVPLPALVRAQMLAAGRTGEAGATLDPALAAERLGRAAGYRT